MRSARVHRWSFPRSRHLSVRGSRNGGCCLVSPGGAGDLERSYKLTYFPDQPRSQFLQMGYHFAQLLAFSQLLRSGTAAMRESLLSEMVRLCATIINLAMDTSDERTRHLTDHIYHVITFSSVTLCRLVHTYEAQLQRTSDVAELDALVLRSVAWMRSIGLTVHVAHTLGDVISALHKKLRPDAQAATSADSETDQSIQTDMALMFPDLLGSEWMDISNGELWPDWDPFISDTTT